jgi:uncharacterized OB-fold protein
MSDTAQAAVQSSSRPLVPAPNADTKPFWDGCAKGELLLQQCAKCKAFRHPPSPICARCLSAEHAWVRASGRATLYTYVVVNETRAKGFDKMVPYVLAVVTLEEGPRMLTNLTNVAPEAVKIDMPLEVTFAELDGTTKLPLFEPRSA